ncbi:hypothetical protein AB0N07_39000 [Streptomyces sp. NPDC051172]|uniref:hypothetical protein n=1 Tax=Streptomyces sp. NPDC051172 TaxID=3155796 RepID=UPI0034402D2A
MNRPHRKEKPWRDAANPVRPEPVVRQLTVASEAGTATSLHGTRSRLAALGETCTAADTEVTVDSGGSVGAAALLPDL